MLKFYHLYRAVSAGVTIMNEIGVDPGIDHMLAMECFDGVKASGGKVNNLSANTKSKDGVYTQK